MLQAQRRIEADSCRHAVKLDVRTRAGMTRWGRGKNRDLAVAGTMMQDPALPLARKTLRRAYEQWAARDVEKLFVDLADRWHQETAHSSSITKVVMHPAYQQIIGLGKEALPLLLESLRSRPGYWFWALESIARETPVTPDIAGHTRSMKRAWLDWGEKRGLISR